MNGFEINDGVLTKYSGSDIDVVIPDGVTAIGDDTFYRCENLQSITVPDSVTIIGNSAFKWCKNLQSINIPNSVTSIGDGAFDWCYNLQSITIPDSVTSIGNEAFYECRNLQSINIPNSVTSIGNSAFYNCGNLQSIIIPDSVTSIGHYAFYDCHNLQSIHISRSVTSIGNSTFYNCRKLQSMNIPGSVTSIGDSAFEWCQNLQSTTIPDSVTSIGDGAFSGCENLQSFELPDSLQSISRIFGENFPLNLVHKISAWYPLMSDGAFKRYVLTETTWNALDADLQTEILTSKYSKALTKSFLPLITETPAENTAAYYLTKAKSALSAADCKKIASFTVNFHNKLSDQTVQSLYEALKAQKNGKKPAEEMEKDPILLGRLSKRSEAQKELTETEKKLLAFADAQKISVAALEMRLKEYYALTASDIPAVNGADGKTAPPLVMLYLLTAHETAEDNEVIAQYKKPGVSPQAADLLALLDPVSLQEALRSLATRNLGIKGHSKAMYLAHPICRYADETLMEELTKQAPKWRSSVSGNEAPPLRTFREACVYSETRAALMLGDKYNDLDRFASVRGTTADLLRDRMLSDVGLSADGTKTYALGNQAVTAVLQSDLTFTVRLENGKTAKSLPKKGADPAAYESANADFSSMKKNAKKIVKNRQDLLFGEFLSGKERSADEWKAAYTENPLLCAVASLLVWKQGNNTFVLTANGTVTSDEKPYEIGKTKISLAHPMEMDADDLAAWQKYFVANGLKQPFEQIWAPVIDPTSIRKDRYKDCMIPYYRFTGKRKHGIFVTDADFHNEIDIKFADLDANVKRIDWRYHEILPEDRFEVISVAFDEYTRISNHVIAYLDRITMYGRILNDDTSIEHFLPAFTLAQITEFIRLATENDCVNVTALLLNYKNTIYPDFDPFDEFSLDFDD